jgi:hypothetical protein
MLIAYEGSPVTLSSGVVIIHLYESRIKNCKRKCPRNKLSNRKGCGGQGEDFIHGKIRIMGVGMSTDFRPSPFGPRWDGMPNLS